MKTTTLKIVAVIATFFLLTACVSAPKRVAFEKPHKTPLSVPGFVSTFATNESSEISVFFPEVQYANFPSKLVLMIKNKKAESIYIAPEKDFEISSKTAIKTHFGSDAKKVLNYFSNSAFGKDCKVDPARTMAGYTPPMGWNTPFKNTEIKPGDTVTEYLLIDPAKFQLSDLKMDLKVARDKYQFNIKSR